MQSNFLNISKKVNEIISEDSKSSLNKSAKSCFEISNFKSEFLLTDDELQYLLLIEFNNQQKNQKLYYAFYKSSPVPQINNGKILTVVAFAALGFFAAPLLGIGAITGVLIGAAIGWRLSGGAKKPEIKTKTQKQERIVSTPGFDSAPQPPQIGGVIPLIFTNTDVNSSGGVRVNGNVINSYVRTYQNKQILYTLVALGLGEIVQIDNSQLLIDNQPLENFYDNVVTINTVNGQENQPGFYNYPWYSQVISPNNNNTFGLSYRGSVIFGSVSVNTFRVAESDYDSFNSTERYRVNGLDFRVINKYIDGTNYFIVTNRTFTTFNNNDRKIYATFRTKYKTLSKCTRLELNFAFEISARDKTTNEATTFALVFDVFLDGKFIRRFYETNKKEGTIRRTLFLTNLTYKKHLIETYSHAALDNSPLNIRLDDSGIFWTIPTGVFDEGKEIILVAGSNPNNQQTSAKVNDYLNVDTKSSMSSDRGANAKLTTVNEITYPIDLGHPNMTNYRNIALQDLAIEASDNIQSSPAVSTLVKKGIKYRNHIAAGEASINSQSNSLIANGVNISEVQAGYVCRNISRQTESLITNIFGSTIITQTSLNWEPGESFLIYFEGAINYFPDIFVYTRLNKKGGVRGLSISEKFIDYPSICSARRFCKSNRLFWDGVIDQSTKWNSWVLQESLGSLLYPFKYSGNYGLRQEEVTNPVDIFNSARIFPGTFSQNKPDNTKINCVQLTYNANEENFTKRDQTITVMTADAYYNKESLQIENLNFESITDFVQAKRVAARFLKSRILQNKVIEFTTGLSGFNCREGDLIIVQYALTELESEVSGFCLTAQNFANGNQEITLSKPVSEELNNQGYTASIYHLESGNVQTSKAFSVLVNGNLLVTGLSEAIKPAREKFNGDVVVINKNISEKIYRISTIKPENYGVKITAVNWSANIHVDSDLFFVD